jgi:alanyl-tRNA synthetase
MVSVGLERLEGVIAQILQSGGNTIPGNEIFKLYDTFGFPLDFTKEIADEKAVNLDMAGFEAELERQRERARQAWKGDEGRVNPAFQEFADKGGTQFLGYQAVRSTAHIIGIVRDGAPSGDARWSGRRGRILLDQTPFYAESEARSAISECSRRVQEWLAYSTHIPRFVDSWSGFASNTESWPQELKWMLKSTRRLTHCCKPYRHSYSSMRSARRPRTARQAGWILVAPDRLRFDYSFRTLTAAEIQEIERRINSVVFKNLPVQTQIMKVNDAIT